METFIAFLQSGSVNGLGVLTTRQTSCTRGTDLSGSLEGVGGIGGLLGRSHGYSSGTGNWSTHSFYHADGNGNVTYLLNSGQSKVAEYRYDPFGNTISSSGTLAAANVYRFSSKEFHVNSGLYYYGYRFYDPNLQRWLNRDPINELGFKRLTRSRGAFILGDVSNLFQFVRNDPGSNIDPTGLAIWKCSRQTEWPIPGLQHTYLWDDRPEIKGPRSCGRDGSGAPGLGRANGVSNPLDKGPDTDSCVQVDKSSGKEAAIMKTCRTPRYMPFPDGTCHEWTKNSLENNDLDDPSIYGKIIGPSDVVLAFHYWWGRQIRSHSP